MTSIRRFVRVGGVAAILLSGMGLGAFAATSAASADGFTWSVVAPVGITSGSFSGVACVSVSDCWAVGQQPVAGMFQTATAHWNGSAWSDVSSPNTSTQINDLSEVTCVGSSNCWAVGTAGSSDGLSEATLAEHWSGGNWSIVTTPNTTAEINQLIGVACTNASDCWAVGDEAPVAGDLPRLPLAEHWDGSAWSIVATPNTNSTESTLGSVTCISSVDCWAVGIGGLAEHWDGSAWSIVATPGPTQSSELLSVACTSTSDCWDVGVSGLPGLPDTLTEHWDGSTWSIIASPNPRPSDQNYLSGVDCITASNCWASGYSVVSDHTDDTLVEHWDGSAWSIVVTPNVTSAVQNILAGVACPTNSDCWVVGNADTQTLIEHGTLPAAPTITSVSSSSDPARVDQRVTYTAAVGVVPPGTGSPTGTVSFSDNATPISGCGAVLLSSEKATCTVTYPKTGSHAIVATYSGDANFTGSTSLTLGEAVMRCVFGKLGCDLAGANLENADVAGQTFGWTNLAYSDLAGTDLENTTFLFTTFVQANLIGADLRGAKLGLIDFDRANLANANLDGAKLFVVNVSGVIWSNTVCPDGTDSSAEGGTCLGHL